MAATMAESMAESDVELSGAGDGREAGGDRDAGEVSESGVGAVEGEVLQEAGKQAGERGNVADEKRARGWRGWRLVAAVVLAGLGLGVWRLAGDSSRDSVAGAVQDAGGVELGVERDVGGSVELVGMDAATSGERVAHVDAGVVTVGDGRTDVGAGEGSGVGEGRASPRVGDRDGTSPRAGAKRASPDRTGRTDREDGAVSPERVSGGQGTVKISATPWARVTVSGSDASCDETPCVLTLSAGRYVLQLVNPIADLRKDVSVVVEADESVVVNARLGEP